MSPVIAMMTTKNSHNSTNSKSKHTKHDNETDVHTNNTSKET